MDFISLLPDVNNDVSIKILEQFPEFSQNSVLMIEAMKELCNSAIDNDTEITNQSISAYKQVLDELSLILKKEDLTDEDRKYFADKMIEVADKIGLKDTESKEFKGKVLGTVRDVVLATLVIGASILGKKLIGGTDKK